MLRLLLSRGMRAMWTSPHEQGVQSEIKPDVGKGFKFAFTVRQYLITEVVCGYAEPGEVANRDVVAWKLHRPSTRIPRPSCMRLPTGERYLQVHSTGESSEASIW
jgi:hypothetical protein